MMPSGADRQGGTPYVPGLSATAIVETRSAGPNSVGRGACGVGWELGAVVLAVLSAWAVWRIVANRRRSPLNRRGVGERLLREGPFALVVWDVERRVVDWNPRAERLFGWSKTEAVGRDALELLVPAAHRDDVSAALARVLREGTPLTASNANLTKSGATVVCEWHNLPLRDRRGRISGAASFALDVTDRRRVESERQSFNQARRRSETRLRRLFQSNLVGIGVGDAAGCLTEANDVLLRLLGYSREDLDAGLTWRKLFATDREPFDPRSAIDPGRVGAGAATERELVRKDGSRAPVLFGVAGFEPEESSIVCFALDIAERKRAEREVQAAHSLIEAIRQAQLDFIGGAEIGPALEHLLQALLKLTGSRRGLIGEVLRDDPAQAARLKTRAVAGFVDEAAEREFAEVLDAVLISERPIIRGGSESGTTFLCLPCRRGPTLLAVIALADRLEGFDESVVDFLEPVASTCAGLISALREEQRRSRVEAELQASKEAAEAAGQAKDRFLAILSHELRTPLTPVLVAATALLEEGPSAEARPFLEMVRRNVELEARLIDDLLDVSRIVRGELRLDPQRLDVHEQIRRAVEICEPETAACGIAVALDLAASERYVRADRARLLQIFWNLIRNACKFTPAGGRLAIRSRSVQGIDDDWLIVEFEDTGSGIDPEVLPRIFEPFEQGAPKLRGRQGGLGLGLAIGRSVAEAHGGRLEARSDGPGRGSTFRLELRTIPAPKVPPASAPIKQNGVAVASKLARPTMSEAPGARILLVEDNPDTLRYLSMVLRRRGHQIRAVAGVEEALRAADDAEFDLLISDIELPDGTGIELFRELTRDRGMQLPGIAMSGFGSEDDVHHARAAGFSVHLTKPVDFPTLDAAIRRVIAAEAAVGPL